MVQLLVKIGKSWTFDNIFFGELLNHNTLMLNNLQFSPVFVGPFLGRRGTRSGHLPEPISGGELGIKAALEWPREKLEIRQMATMQKWQQCKFGKQHLLPSN
jgi:hypothetical protein